MHGGLLIGGSIEVVIQRENERNILFLCFWARLSYPSTTSSALYRSLQRQRLLVLNVKNSTNTILECSFSYSLPVCYVAYERIKLGNYSNKPPPPRQLRRTASPSFALLPPVTCFCITCIQGITPGLPRAQTGTGLSRCSLKRRTRTRTRRTSCAACRARALQR